jgi:hypothetical protein
LTISDIELKNSRKTPDGLMETRVSVDHNAVMESVYYIMTNQPLIIVMTVVLHTS